jgi:uncharacterized linocin/CFP29 family protein
MNHLLRELAPISEVGWAAIETEAKGRLTTQLAARKLVDLNGPHGWTYSATDVGHVTSVDGPANGVEARQRLVQPLVELRRPFSVSRAVVDDAARGAQDLDFGELEDAARQMGEVENNAVFHGYGAAGITGITQASSHAAIPLGGVDQYPTSVAMAVNALRIAGIAGPYGMAIAPSGYTRIIETAEHGGYLLLDHLHQILGGPVVWAPGVVGAVVLSLRGGDFVMDAGQDVSIGYLAHDAEQVQLYLEESVGFRVIEPDAAIALTE